MWRQELKALEWKSLEGEDGSGASELDQSCVSLDGLFYLARFCLCVISCVCTCIVLSNHQDTRKYSCNIKLVLTKGVLIVKEGYNTFGTYKLQLGRDLFEVGRSQSLTDQLRVECDDDEHLILQMSCM